MRNLRAVVTGVGTNASLGYLIAESLEFAGISVLGWTKDPKTAKGHYIKLPLVKVDLCDVRSIDEAYRASMDCHEGAIDILINCAGVNRLAMVQSLSQEDWDTSMNVNARAPMLTIQRFMPVLQLTEGTVINIGSSAAYQPMTASLAYNASKAALDMLTRQMAREFSRNRIPITVFGINPNKLAGTPMSLEVERQVCAERCWTAEESREYQLASLPSGKETDPKELGHFVAYLLGTKERHRMLAGCVLPYGTQL